MRWEWYSDVAFELTPYWFERNRYPRGVRLGQRQSLNVNGYEYGFDTQDRVTVLREYSGFLGGRQTCETTWTYHDDSIDEVRTDADGQIGYTHRFQLADGLMISQDMAARYGTGSETYTYTGGRLTGIEILHNGRPWQTVAVSHDDAGVLQRISTTWLQEQPHTETTYQRPPSDFTLAGQADTVSALLYPWILAEVERLGLGEPAYCLALSYEEDGCLPQLCVGLESERQKWSQMEDPESLIWNPAEFQNQAWDDEPMDSTLADAANLLDQECGLRGDRVVARGMLNAIARRLNGVDWSPLLPTTSDFIVYAVDLDLVHLEANLAEVSPVNRCPAPPGR